MSPKHEASFEMTFNIARCLAVLIYNDIYYKLGQILTRLCGFTGFSTENIMISLENERLHNANKKQMSQQKKLIRLRTSSGEKSDEDNNDPTGTDNLTGTSDKDDENEDNSNDSADNDNFDDGSYDDISSNNDASDFETSDDKIEDPDGESEGDTLDENNYNNTNEHVEDLYYNPKSQNWIYSDEDN